MLSRMNTFCQNHLADDRFIVSCSTSQRHRYHSLRRIFIEFSNKARQQTTSDPQFKETSSHDIASVSQRWIYCAGLAQIEKNRSVPAPRRRSRSELRNPAVPPLAKAALLHHSNPFFAVHRSARRSPHTATK